MLINFLLFASCVVVGLMGVTLVVFLLWCGKNWVDDNDRRTAVKRVEEACPMTGRDAVRFVGPDGIYASTGEQWNRVDRFQ